jgi:hypothetical protein
MRLLLDTRALLWVAARVHIGLWQPVIFHPHRERAQRLSPPPAAARDAAVVNAAICCRMSRALSAHTATGHRPPTAPR